MNRFFGLDLGDAESAVSRLEKTGQDLPEILPVQGEKSFVTAYAALRNGDLLIGEKACYAAEAVTRRIRFKSRFLTDKSSHGDIRSFAAGILGELYRDGNLIQNEDCAFYVGCPAGWKAQAREEYREIFEKLGYPPTRIVSESRAALVSACQSKHLQVGYDILSRPVLVVDIGSSTTDFAYICSGREVEMQTAGEVMLGGGLMDEILLEEAVKASSREAEIRQVFRESEAWKNYCEFAARRLKEKYFSDPDYWQDKPCTVTLRILYDEPLSLTLSMDENTALLLENKPVEKLSGKSFREVFGQSLRDVRANISGQMPELLFLTGGVSRHPKIRAWCSEVFPEAVVISGSEPEFSVARGLAFCGRVDEELKEFKEDLEKLKAGRTVEDIVQKNLDMLYRMAVDTLVEPILTNAAEPVYRRWRNGDIKRLGDTDEEMQKAIEVYLRTEEARELLVRPITAFLKPVADELEEHTIPICLKHHVPYRALSLKSYLSLSELDIRIDAKDVFAVEEITWMIDSIISVLVGLLCGGSGIALISSGPTGILAGTVLSLLVLALGKEKMEGALLKADIPGPMRKLVPKNAFRSRMETISKSVRDNLYQSLERDKSQEISARMTDEISLQIEECLTRMAEVVEIPLG